MCVYLCLYVCVSISITSKFPEPLPDSAAVPDPAADLLPQSHLLDSSYSTYCSNILFEKEGAIHPECSFTCGRAVQLCRLR